MSSDGIYQEEYGRTRALIILSANVKLKKRLDGELIRAGGAYCIWNMTYLNRMRLDINRFERKKRE